MSLPIVLIAVVLVGSTAFHHNFPKQQYNLAVRRQPENHQFCQPNAPLAATSGSEESTRCSRPAYIPNRISDPNYVRIFDTTLRDGEQVREVWYCLSCAGALR